MGKQDFLIEILGVHGQKALENANKLSKNIENIVFTRALLSWVSLVSKYGFSNKIPGQSSSFDLNKSEDGLNGYIELESQVFKFENKNEEYVAALLAVSMGADGPMENHNGVAVAKLGKSIDCLVKTEFVNKNIQKSFPRYHAPQKPSSVAEHKEPIPPHPPQSEAPKQSPPKGAKVGTSMGKTEIKSKKKSFVFRLKKHELMTRCETCSSLLFKDESYIGCICYSNEGISLLKSEEGFSLKFNANCDSDLVLALIGSIKNAGK